MNIPFSSNWIYSNCLQYCKSINIKGSNYKNVRKKIQKLCKFFIFKLPIKNIIVLKNYYSKNTFLICVKPIFGHQCIFIKTKNNFHSYVTNNKKFNVFEEYKNGIK